MRLRILSYNIHRAIGVDRRFRPNRIANIILHHDADIVLLQEVDVGVPRSKRMDLSETLAELTGYPYRALGLNVKLRKGMYGNATLSRYPFIEEKNIDLTIDKRKSRGCLYTQVSLPSRKQNNILSIFNLHLGIAVRGRNLDRDRLFDDATGFLLRLVNLFRIGRHVGDTTSIEYGHLGAETPGNACRVHRHIARPHYGHLAPDLERLCLNGSNNWRTSTPGGDK